MKKITVAIMEEDAAYGRALSKAIALTRGQFEVHVSPPSSDWEQYDLFLINEENISFLPEELKKRTVILTERKCSVSWSGDSSEPLQIYKYERVSIMTSALQYYYSKIYQCINPFSSFGKQPFVVGIFSGSGGIGCTSTAILLARELTQKKKKKVLFLSLEEMESTSFYFRFPQGHPFMGDYLFYLFSDDAKRKTATFYSSFQYQDSYGVELFYPSLGSNELCELSIEETQVFIESISKIGHYDYIVLDCGNHFSDKMILWLEHCSQCVLLRNHTLLSAKKNKKRLECLYRQHYFNGSLLFDYCISKDEESFIEKDKKIEIRSNYTLGSEVKSLANRIRSANPKESDDKRNHECCASCD